MNPRVTLVVVALFALLLGYVYFVELNKTPEQLGTPVPTLAPGVFTLDAKNVKAIQVRDLRAPREVVLTRAGSGWHVDQPAEKPADSPNVDDTLSQIVSLKATRVLTNVTDLAPYGFVTATLEVRLTMSDTTPYGLTVGRQTPDMSGYYAVYTGDKSKVFIVSAGLVDSLASWFDKPPYEPTPTPTFTPSPTGTPTVPGSETPAATPPAGTPPPPATVTPPGLPTP